MTDEYLRGALSPQATQRQLDVFPAYVAAGGSVPDAAKLVGIQPSTAKHHLAAALKEDRASNMCARDRVSREIPA